MKRSFVAYFFFVSWSAFSLGIHIDAKCPNIELHIPFGFFKVGWEIFPLDTSSGQDTTFLTEFKKD